MEALGALVLRLMSADAVRHAEREMQTAHSSARTDLVAGLSKRMALDNSPLVLSGLCPPKGHAWCDLERHCLAPRSLDPMEC